MKSAFSFSQVKAIRNFEINGMMGFWYIIEYYASSEEAAEYACMKCNFSMNTENVQVSWEAGERRASWTPHNFLHGVLR